MEKVVVRVIFHGRGPLEFVKTFTTVPSVNSTIDISRETLQNSILCEDAVMIKSISVHQCGYPLLVTEEIDFHEY